MSTTGTFPVICVCGRERLKVFDRVGYGSFFLLLLEGNFTLIPFSRNNFPFPGNCLVAAGGSNAGVPEVCFPRLHPIIGNKQQNGKLERFQGIVLNPEVILSPVSMTCLNSLSKF